MPDTLVFDIETKNFFTDPGVGRGNFGAIDISVVGTYSYEKDAYVCFAENEMEAAAELFQTADRLVGFALNRFDVPVLNLQFMKLGQGAPNLWEKDRVDILERIVETTGKRASLNRVAEINLGEGKSGKGGDAPLLYDMGRIEELKAYCLKDVELTKRLYDLALERGFVEVPGAGGYTKVSIGLGSPSAGKGTGTLL